MKTIDIIGAGIGGLTLAIALKQQGSQVRVFERAPQLRAVGAGINLACNAMQVYEQLGLREKIELAGHQCDRMQVTDAEMRPLSEIDIRPFSNRYSVSNVAIHRGALQQVLASTLEEDELHLGKQLVGVKQVGDTVQLSFADGTEINSSCVIGADGIHSQVRQKWFAEGEIRSTDQICWRGIADMPLPTPFQAQLTESWGRNGRFGFVQVDAQRTYWFAVIRDAKWFGRSPHHFGQYMRKSGLNQPIGQQQLLTVYQDFHPLVTELLSNTPRQTIHEAVLTDLIGLRTWFRGPVALIGDAAHATTPNLGQGACQAIEDARVLAHYLGHSASAEEAFTQFQTTRQAKVNHIVKTSWTVGKMAHWQNPLSMRLRNTLMRIMPARLGERQSAQIYALEELD